MQTVCQKISSLRRRQLHGSTLQPSPILGFIARSWSSSSAIRLSPSQIGEWGFPAPDSPRRRVASCRRRRLWARDLRNWRGEGRRQSPELVPSHPVVVRQVYSWRNSPASGHNQNVRKAVYAADGALVCLAARISVPVTHPRSELFDQPLRQGSVESAAPPSIHRLTHLPERQRL